MSGNAHYPLCHQIPLARGELKLFTNHIGLGISGAVLTHARWPIRSPARPNIHNLRLLPCGYPGPLGQVTLFALGKSKNYEDATPKQNKTKQSLQCVMRNISHASSTSSISTMANNHYSYYSRGYVVEYLDPGEDRCSSWLLLPAENLWPEWFRGLLYCIALFYFFVGIAIASDIFMCSIEVITARKRTISKWDPDKNEMVEREVLIWNETVANLTLMALGSSAPEILLAVVEAVTSLDDKEPADSLGTFTIIGSAAFNMLIITAVCIISVPTPQSKSIKEFGVFVVTGIWSIWAYIWMLLVVKYISPGVVDPWEAWVTLLFLPVLVLMAYLQDLGWCCCTRKRVGDSEEGEHDPTTSVRVVTSHPHPQFLGHQHKELHVLEAQKAHRMSENAVNLPTHSTPERELQAKINKPSTTLARARFRHAVVGSLLGSKAFRPHSVNKPIRLAEVVEVVTSWNEAMKQGKAPDMADSLGKFTFGSDRYAVLESAGKLEIEIFFHRKVPYDASGDSISDINIETKG
ncbi:sodium/calcium exchanger 3 [Plakobranchus ocellatus]|uniref:Sodium/calcium exchanger 3 n=1 Tax=Plakobranchus ocellatus TaxID=259542 RepID=A0AAV4C2J3_9GAST|nr:sodium/calcium exchanger 3 [Plakobranchus ocellatus]